MKFFGVTDKGIVRQDNQDAFAIKRIDKKDCTIAVICDGMGGQNAGAVASDLAVRTFVEYITSKLTSRINKNPNYLTVLLNACNEANSVAYDYSKFDDSFSGMGTTLVGGIISDDGDAIIINVGDSRCYLINEDSITQVTTDHSLVEGLVSSGAITREQAKHHTQKSIITRAVGSEDTINPDIFELKINSNERLLFCSDGLSNYVDEEIIKECCLTKKSPEDICKTLLNLTYSNGAGDNVTIISVVN